MLQVAFLSIARMNVCVMMLQRSNPEYRKDDTDTHTHTRIFLVSFSSSWQVFGFKESIQTVGIEATRDKSWQREEAKYQPFNVRQINTSAVQGKKFIFVKCFINGSWKIQIFASQSAKFLFLSVYLMGLDVTALNQRSLYETKLFQGLFLCFLLLWRSLVSGVKIKPFDISANLFCMCLWRQKTF